RERAESFGYTVAARRDHAPAQMLAKPAFGNLLLWKTVYEEGERYYVDAARLGWSPRAFPGQNARRLDLERDLPWMAPRDRQAHDLERFRWFSSGYVALDPAHADRVIDVRYSMVPNRIEALWGIALDPSNPDGQARFFTSRDVTREDRAEILRMLFD
ncbi:MAG: hypothetical protein MI867_04600, partial [Pseudomonadales bacterium]|nr:hypothetical protein [Pseudomonadales bacterium]